MKLYGIPPSRAVRAMWLLNELGLDYEMSPVNVLNGENRTEAFLALNPAAKVPVLVDEGTVVTESVAIQLYLAEKHPESGLIPERVEDRAQMHRWNFFLVTELEQPLWRIARHTLIYPEAKRLPPDIELARQECLEMVDVLENHMLGRKFVVAERLTVADFNAAYTLDWVQHNGLLSNAPGLTKYLQSMYARPAAPPTFAEAIGKTR